jgi:hypothetical protein
MPVVYTCLECGKTHPAPVEYDSKAAFDAVPWDREVGVWLCGNRPRPVRRTYIQAQLSWVSNYESAEWDELQQMFQAAREVVRLGWPGSGTPLREIEDEIAARKFRVVARYPKKVVVWAGFRTRAECHDYLKWRGVKAGLGHEHEGARYEVVIEEAGCGS